MMKQKQKRRMTLKKMKPKQKLPMEVHKLFIIHSILWTLTALEVMPILLGSEQLKMRKNKMVIVTLAVRTLMQIPMNVLLLIHAAPPLGMVSLPTPFSVATHLLIVMPALLHWATPPLQQHSYVVPPKCLQQLLPQLPLPPSCEKP